MDFSHLSSDKGIEKCFKYSEVLHSVDSDNMDEFKDSFLEILSSLDTIEEKYYSGHVIKICECNFGRAIPIFRFFNFISLRSKNLVFIQAILDILMKISLKSDITTAFIVSLLGHMFSFKVICKAEVVNFVKKVYKENIKYLKKGKYCKNIHFYQNRAVRVLLPFSMFYNEIKECNKSLFKDIKDLLMSLRLDSPLECEISEVFCNIDHHVKTHFSIIKNSIENRGLPGSLRRIIYTDCVSDLINYLNYYPDLLEKEMQWTAFDPIIDTTYEIFPFDYSASCGSIKCFKFIVFHMNSNLASPDLFISARGLNYDIIHYSLRSSNILELAIPHASSHHFPIIEWFAVESGFEDENCELDQKWEFFERLLVSDDIFSLWKLFERGIKLNSINHSDILKSLIDNGSWMMISVFLRINGSLDMNSNHKKNISAHNSLLSKAFRCNDIVSFSILINNNTLFQSFIEDQSKGFINKIIQNQQNPFLDILLSKKSIDFNIGHLNIVPLHVCITSSNFYAFEKLIHTKNIDLNIISDGHPILYHAMAVSKDNPKFFMTLINDPRTRPIKMIHPSFPTKLKAYLKR